MFRQESISYVSDMMMRMRIFRLEMLDLEHNFLFLSEAKIKPNYLEIDIVRRAFKHHIYAD